MSLERAALVALRIGLAFALLYPPVNALIDPSTWIGYFPAFTRGFVSDVTLLHLFGAAEVVIAIWILSGWRIFWPSTVAAAMLIAIVVFNTSSFQVVFRDVSIAAMAIALALSDRKTVSAFFRLNDVYAGR